MKKFLSIIILVAVLAPNVVQAVISFVGSAEDDAASNADPTVVLSGISMQQDDLVIVACGLGDGDAVNGDVTINTTGYTEINDLFQDDTHETNFAVFYKFMGATPDSDVICEGSTLGNDAGTAAVAMVFRGVDTGTPFDVTSTTATAADDPDADPPSIDWSTTGVWTVIAVASANALSSTCTTDAYVFPTGYTTDQIECSGNDTVDISVGMSYNSAPVDPENPGIVDRNGTDSTNNSWAAFTMALRPLVIIAPTVTTQTATSITDTDATLNGNITATGGENATTRGFAYGTDSTLSTGVATTSLTGSFGTGAFTSSSSPDWTANTDWDAPDDVGGFAASALVDLDNDGDFDLMLGDSGGIVDGYENTGIASSPTWTSNDDWDSPNVADWAAPTLADLDNDNDFDMMIGLNGGPVLAYENTGTVSSPTWTANTDWDMTDVLTVSRPALVDIDNDGDYDMMIGENAGIVLGYENTGTVSSPTWTANTDWNTEDMGASPSPTFADLDEDGDFDLIIGEVGGISEGYENTGTASSPTWTANTDWNTPDAGDWAAPALADLDDDNDFDLMVGNGSGFALGYENTGPNVSLSCDNTYYFRPYATNIAGTGYGAISSSFTTDACAAGSPPTVTTNTETNVGVSSATLNGEITDTGGENATVRGFAWGTDSAFVANTATTTESGSFGIATFSQNVSGLLAGVTYYFRAYATNPTGTGYGGSDNFTAGTDTSVSRAMRLFEGFFIKLFSGRIILFQQ